MGDRIVIDGKTGWDGSYEIELPPVRRFTAREWGWIRRLTGYTPVSITGPDASGDPEIDVVLAVIALRRHGRITIDEAAATYERLVDLADDRIRFESDEESPGDADGPPPRSSNGNASSSGPGSPTGSETSTPTLPNSGIPASDGSASAPGTSVR